MNNLRLNKLSISERLTISGKNVSKQSKDALKTIKTTSEVIDYLFETLRSDNESLELLEKQVTTLAFNIGLLKRENEKLKRVNKRLSKGL